MVKDSEGRRWKRSDGEMVVSAPLLCLSGGGQEGSLSGRLRVWLWEFSV